MRKSIVSFFVLIAAVFAVTASSSTEASAQRRKQPRANAQQLRRANLDRIIARVEERVDRFTSQFNDSLDNSRLNGTRREDNLNERARDLESATDELRREFDRNDSKQENRAEVQRCLDIASDINVAMRNRRFSRATENNWANVRAELNQLARAYNLPAIGGAYR